MANKQDMNESLSFRLMFRNTSCNILEKLLSAWCEDISCKLLRNLSHKYEDKRTTSARATETMIRPQTCKTQAELCFLFQTFSIKSIVSWPLECNLSLLSLLFLSLRDWDHYCMKWCTLLWLCLTFIAFSFLSFFFFSPYCISAFLFFFLRKLFCSLLPSGFISSFV